MNKTKNIVLAAMFSALILLATLFLKVPSPLGYVNLGDGFILLAAFLMPMPYAVIASGIGSVIADLLAGYAPYAPGTFVIKAAVALVAALLFKAFLKLNLPKVASLTVASVVAEAIMVGGYLLYEWVVLAYGAAALVSCGYNAVQGVFGVVIAVLLYLALSRVLKRKEQQDERDHSNC